MPNAADEHLIEIDGWAEALSRQCTALRDELLLLAPWLTAPKGELNSGVPVADGESVPTLRALATFNETGDGALPDSAASARAQAAAHARARIAAIDALLQQAGALAEVDYSFLFDKVRRQFVIGYNVSDARTDASYYDLLASEARLANFVAIAQGKLPQESWFALGRLLTSVGGEPVLLSWSGSMFEYLMPLLDDADVRKHAARSDLHRSGRPADRIRAAARGAVGRVGVRLQHRRRPRQLSVPRLRCPGARAEARTCR